MSAEKAAPEVLLWQKALNSDSQTSRYKGFYRGLFPHSQCLLKFVPPPSEEQSSGQGGLQGTPGQERHPHPSPHTAASSSTAQLQDWGHSVQTVLLHIAASQHPQQTALRTIWKLSELREPQIAAGFAFRPHCTHRPPGASIASILCASHS